MENMNDVVRLAVDAYHGKPQKYSMDESMEVLRSAAIEANGGKSYLDFKSVRDGKCNGLFTLIEEILSRTVVEGLQGDEYFNSFVDFRNVAEGDKNIFVVEDSDLFVVSNAANGTQGIRRQRLGGATTTSIPTTLKVVKIYEELNRVLSGQVDFNRFISKVSESVRQKILNDTYDLWANATSADFGGSPYYLQAVAGTFVEANMLDLIGHVEAAAGGKQATIIGTKKALRNLAPAIQGADSKSDLYNMGYYGKYYGTPVFAIPQRHYTGTRTFVMSDTVLNVVAGDDKPLKVVYEGQSLIIPREATDNMDLTMEYLYGEKYGMGLILSGDNAGMGRYDLTP